MPMFDNEFHARKYIEAQRLLALAAIIAALKDADSDQEHVARAQAVHETHQILRG